MKNPRSDLVVSIATVFVNKTLLSSQEVALEAPLFITWFQCIVSFSICYSLSRTGGIPGVFTFPKGTPWNLDVMKRYVGVPFYYIGRSLTTVFNVVFSWVLLGQRTSYRCIFCCGLIILFGFYLGVDQENLLGSFSLIGTMYGVIGSLMLSLYSIYTKKVLPSVNQEVWLLSFYNNAYSIFLFLPLIVTSPLTHNISGTAKACAQTVLATQWYNETKNVLWWTSNIIVLFSSALYARFKQQEMEENSRKPVPEEKQSLV
ncbi:hypothetical protein SFRURICE_006731 [Spodoptera frugiperda]|nr:hypothetical protein SFRURICE_006731 [Spodoptera frugiperda]